MKEKEPLRKRQKEISQRETGGDFGGCLCSGFLL